MKPRQRYVRTGTGMLLVLAGLFFLADLIFPFKPAVEYSTVIRDDRGEIMHAFLTRDEKWRMKTELQEISPTLRQAIVQKEDRYFYYHPGVNHLAILRAFGRNLLYGKRTSGASTITMQVARALEPKRRSYFNKWLEMFRALQLEWHYSKDEILQLYLNLVPYGGNIEGVKAAAFIYLDKNPDHLSLAEITALSIIPNRPSTLVPGKNNDRIVAERNRWLQRLAKENLFTQKQIRDALAEPFLAWRREVPQLVPHLARRLKKTGLSDIRTAINLQAQSKIEQIALDYSRSTALQGIYNAAVLVIDNRSNQIISYCGSSNFSDQLHAGEVDGIVATRQPGSTLKPFVYALAIDQGLMAPKTMLTDVPVHYQGYAPENFDRNFNGYVTMEYALEHSLNIPAVKTLNLVGKDELIRMLARCRFNQIKKDERKLGLSLILGGCGATLEELTSAYSVFATEGVYRPAALVADSQQVRSMRVLSKASSYMITSILSKLNRPDFPLSWQSTERMPKIAWKTGTSYGRRDAWSIGYNKRYTIGVWVGNFDGKGNAALSGAITATPLLFRIFNAIDYDSDESWFQQPSECSERLVCSESGLVPGDHCQHLISDYFIPNITQSSPCSQYQQVAISPDEQISYCKSCQPETGYKMKWFRVLEPAMRQWYSDHRLHYEELPAHNPACEKLFQGNAPVITSPRNGTEYFLSADAPEPILLACEAESNSDIFWYVNDRFYQKGNRLFLAPTEGPLKISCTDDKGRMRTVKIRVRIE